MRSQLRFYAYVKRLEDSTPHGVSTCWTAPLFTKALSTHAWPQVEGHWHVGARAGRARLGVGTAALARRAHSARARHKIIDSWCSRVPALASCSRRSSYRATACCRRPRASGTSPRSPRSSVSSTRASPSSGRPAATVCTVCSSLWRSLTLSRNGALARRNTARMPLVHRQLEGRHGRGP